MEVVPTKTAEHSSDNECGESSAKYDSAEPPRTHSTTSPEPTAQMSKHDGDSLDDYGCFIVEEPPPKDMKNDKSGQE